MNLIRNKYYFYFLINLSLFVFVVQQPHRLVPHYLPLLYIRILVHHEETLPLKLKPIHHIHLQQVLVTPRILVHL